ILPSQHSRALVTSFATENGAGDQTASADAARFTVATTSTFWLKSLDVQGPLTGSAIVAFGDSITDGACDAVDAYERWQDVLARRLARRAHPRLAVINEGIGGDTLLPGYLAPSNVPSALERLDRDVLSHAGVSHVVLFMGSNDINRGASAERVIAGMREIVAR